jgi:hypothetical protein
MDYCGASSGTPPPRQPKLIGQLRDALRLRRYSLKTEKAYRLPSARSGSSISASSSLNNGRSLILQNHSPGETAE